MKLAFTSKADGWKENVDLRFGRSSGFFIYDDEKKETEYFDNSENNDLQHGAGTGTSKKIIDLGVDVLITGRVGPKAEQVLQSSKMQVFTGVEEGTVEEAYNRYLKGELSELK